MVGRVVNRAAIRAVLNLIVDVGQLLPRARRELAHLGSLQVARHKRDQRRDCALFNGCQVNPDAREDGDDNGCNRSRQSGRRHLGVDLR